MQQCRCSLHMCCGVMYVHSWRGDAEWILHKLKRTCGCTWSSSNALHTWCPKSGVMHTTHLIKTGSFQVVKTNSAWRVFVQQRLDYWECHVINMFPANLSSTFQSARNFAHWKSHLSCSAILGVRFLRVFLAFCGCLYGSVTDMFGTCAEHFASKNEGFVPHLPGEGC